MHFYFAENQIMVAQKVGLSATSPRPDFNRRQTENTLAGLWAFRYYPSRKRNLTIIKKYKLEVENIAAGSKGPECINKMN